MTLASPSVNRHQKSDKDAADWLPELNQCWYAERIVQVRLKHGLTIDQREADALESVLSACESTAMVFTECAAGQEGASPEYVIPTAVNTPGRFGAYCKTRVVMHNMSQVGYSITASLYGPNGPAGEQSITMEAGQYRWWDNFLEEVFNYRGAGAVVLVREEDGDSSGNDAFETSFALVADVYTDSDNGRYSTTVINGTFVAAAAPGGEAFNSGISVNENQRTNLGAFNFGGTPSSTEARIFDILSLPNNASLSDNACFPNRSVTSTVSRTSSQPVCLRYQFYQPTNLGRDSGAQLRYKYLPPITHERQKDRRYGSSGQSTPPQGESPRCSRPVPQSGFREELRQLSIATAHPCPRQGGLSRFCTSSPRSRGGRYGKAWRQPGSG